MPFEPRVREEIHKEMVASIVVESELTDVAEGGTVVTLLGAVAEQIEAAEFRLGEIRDSFDFENAAGTDLDERVSQLPPPALQRLAEAAASGPVMQITRGTTGSPLTVPIGTVFGRTDNPDVLYISTEEVTFGASEDTYPPTTAVDPLRVVCSVPGEVGSASPGVVNRIVSGPDDLLTATNVNSLEGRGRETDDELKQRARLYLASLARCQPQALEFIGRTSVASDGTRILHARIFEDPERPCYSELVVDDGFGLEGLDTAGQIVIGTVPDNGQTLIYHQAPATEPITQIAIDKGGGAAVYDQTDPVTGDPRWVSIEERGIIHILDPTLLDPGDEWTIANYRVYTGIVREIQATIEGDPSDPANEPGWRAAGTRVKVVPPTVQPVTVRINVAVFEGVDLVQLRSDMQSEVIAFMRRLAPGEPLFLSKLNAQLCRVFVNELRNLTIQLPTGDTYPGSARTVLRSRIEDVEVV